MTSKNFAIMGGGPAGLSAAEILLQHGHAVTIYDAMPTPARKFLLAGKSGLNITHNEEFSQFKKRFGEANEFLGPALEAFTPADIQSWATDLGSELFVGSSGRVFPTAMKASPLLRAWLAKLEKQGASLKTRHRWQGVKDKAHIFDTPDGQISAMHDGAILAFGGLSWPRLGGNGDWVQLFQSMDIEITPFQPANCGFDVNWSPYFKEKYAGDPVKSVAATSDLGTSLGEFVVSQMGIEGSLIYAHSAALRDQLIHHGAANWQLDLVPGQSFEKLNDRLKKQNSKQSSSNLLRKGAKLTGVKAALVREVNPDASKLPRNELAKLLKSLPLPVTAPRPIKEAISSAGGIKWAELDEKYMLKKQPGLFVAGEMIDWEAPTGGYLISACLATGRAAAKGLLQWGAL